MPMVDTLKAYETLTAANFPVEQAKAILEVVRISQESGLENLVTKAELKDGLAALREDLRAEMADLRDEMRNEMQELRTQIRELRTETQELHTETQELHTEIYRVKFDLLKYLVPLIIGQGAFVVALLKIIR